VEIAAQHAEGERVGAGQDVEIRLLLHRIALQGGDVAAGDPEGALVVEADAADAAPPLTDEAAVAAGDAAYGAVGEGLSQEPFHGACVEVGGERVGHGGGVGGCRSS
jgi:hypothetical protein